MQISFSRKFVKHYEKAVKKIKNAFQERLELFRLDPFHPLLNNHQLTGQFRGFRSINITGDWRAIFSEYITDTGKKVIIFEIIDTHSNLYK
ncbi:type II toxin-antitoxin system mRNA interferase toxin, RelE/StbE family [Candidatus Gottesmanbacteria bacterium]|nr:type II toxin-antitoxin system mRNA interferase toxin, RelE/StbE family [Candidatus Gottesmanbacteria bacterium]